MSLIYEAYQLLTKNQETVSVAESCTGGGLANEISKLAGISKIFLGGVVTYANSAKINLLDIPKETLEQKGAVSEEVARMMAQNCKELFASTWAISTTGIAGPSGGSTDKPIGLVWIGIAGPNILCAKKYIFANISRMEHRQKTIDHALQMLISKCAKVNRDVKV